MYIKYTDIANANDSISKAESIHGELLSAFTVQISNFFRPGIFCTYQGSGRQLCTQAFRSFPELLGAKKRDHPFKVIGGCIRHVSYSYVSDSSSIRIIRLWSAAIDQPFGWLSISTFALLSHLYTHCHKKRGKSSFIANGSQYMTTYWTIPLVKKFIF